MSGNTTKYMSSIPPASVNPVVIDSVSPQPNTEVEIRLERNSSKRPRTEYTCDAGLANTMTHAMTRKCATSGNVVPTCTSEIELLEKTTDGNSMRLVRELTGVVGSTKSMLRNIDQVALPAARRADRAVVDVRAVPLYEAKSIPKRPEGYYARVSGHQHPLREMLSDPDILIAAMVIDGSLVYLDTLYMNGDAVQDSRGYPGGPYAKFQKPPHGERET
ncbi:hypothetical protein DL764_009919 [Monosporascus ibericus]|uniref:Uncharacterized protein n=1 Tax=Monosporascus ibericus TaxID=155417 RepID=A0A4Q4SWS9_9PEZI|nr:hypothetical protein DL764_009919 [Monosporascus ibericus]